MRTTPPWMPAEQRRPSPGVGLRRSTLRGQVYPRPESPSAPSPVQSAQIRERWPTRRDLFLPRRVSDSGQISADRAISRQ